MTARGDRGATLIELVAVMAIFSVIALIAVQLLSSGLRNRAALEGLDDPAARLSAMAAVLRRDMERAAPVVGPGGAPVFAVTDGGAVLTLAVSGAPGEALRAPEPVTWVFAPGAGSVQRGAGAPLLDGVTGWDLRLLDASDRWVPAAEWRGETPHELPRALELRLEVTGLGPMRLVAGR